MKRAIVALIIVLSLLPSAVLAASGSNAYQQNNLTADTSGKAAHTDPQLVNPWGNAFFSGGAFWVSDNKTGLSTLYDALGNKQGLVVTIPPAVSGTGSPTGIVANNTASFGGSFLFVTLDGTVQAWAGAASAVIKVTKQGAVYTGMTQVTSNAVPFLLAANFNSGAVDIYDGSYHTGSLAGNFTDPTLPAGYAPYGIHNIGGTVYITYAQQNAAKNAPVLGKGLGYVSEFDQNGNFLKRLASAGALNAPWGVAVAPSTGFGMFSNAVLIGNYGDGAINAYNATTLKFMGGMHNGSGMALKNPGLFELVFGAGGTGTPNTLFITVGVGGGAHGLLASLTVVPVSLLPSSMKFTAPVNTMSAAKPAMLTNNTSASISISSVTSSDPTHFVITSNTCGASLAPGASCTIKVAFAPTAKGALNGTLSVTDTGAGSPQQVKLTGTGT